MMILEIWGLLHGSCVQYEQGSAGGRVYTHASVVVPAARVAVSRDVDVCVAGCACGYRRGPGGSDRGQFWCACWL